MGMEGTGSGGGFDKSYVHLIVVWPLLQGMGQNQGSPHLLGLSLGRLRAFVLSFSLKENKKYLDADPARKASSKLQGDDLAISTKNSIDLLFDFVD